MNAKIDNGEKGITEQMTEEKRNMALTGKESKGMCQPRIAFTSQVCFANLATVTVKDTCSVTNKPHICSISILTDISLLCNKFKQVKLNWAEHELIHTVSTIRSIFY